jgi:predicted DNA-binding transcriptional regulator AlpA
VPQRRTNGGKEGDVVESLQDAFKRSRHSIKWPWHVKISRPPSEKNATQHRVVVRIELTADDAAMLARILDRVELAPGVGGPWMSTAEVAELLHVTQATIRSWFISHKPKRHPFPTPEATRSGRNYWLRSTIEEWKADEDRMSTASRRSRSR